MLRYIYMLCLFLQLWIMPTHGWRTVYGRPQATSQFVHWYDQYGDVFRNIMRDDCSKEYQNYLYSVDGNVTIDWQHGGDEPSSITQPVILCILNNTSDYIKSAMSGAQVLLGLTPTVLALLGPSSAELSLLTVVARRPGLAAMLALACPSVYLSRAFDQSNPLDILKERPGRLAQWRLKGWKRWFLVLFQYGITLIALSNLATLYYQLGVRTVCIFWPNGTIAVVVWGVLVLPVHVVGTFIFRLQAQRAYREESLLEPLRLDSFRQWWKWIKHSPRRAFEMRKTEIVPAASQDDMYIIPYGESKMLILLNWALTPSIIIHVLTGTLVLSSLTFIGPRDAVLVVARFMISVLVCRAVLMYEIAGIRDRYNSDCGGLVPLEVLPISQADDLITKVEGSPSQYVSHIDSVWPPQRQQQYT
ncbi:hypothetical protein HD806DRAFT_478111 [Xylariaceae sp. AK1471]|nr:hypothetical protein HD806DRAFT_478111 [Xylariaceae sp. AK1471]